VGQGALGIVVRADRDDVLRRVHSLGDAPTAAATACERALLGALEGGCQVPIGALATVDGDGIALRAMVSSLDGTRILRVAERGSVASAVELGLRAADALRAAGADAVLADARAGYTPLDIAP
jgi:hydroxymethylbilane synthase